MKGLFLFSMLALISQSSFAALTYECNVSLNNGTKYYIAMDAQMTEGKSDEIINMRVFKNDNIVLQTIDEELSSARISGERIVVSATDDHGVEVVNIQYFGKKNKKNLLVLSLPNQKKLNFKDVKCGLSQDF
jgi:hypothetical protein